MILVIILGLGYVAFACGAPPPRPNILLIMTDDQGFGDYAMSGNPSLRTPNLDRLAAESVRFDYFYVAPVCAPTRAGLLTGRYHPRTGVRSVTNGYETMDPEEVTMGELFVQAGYRTGLFGKWHLGEYYPGVPNVQGFDEYVGFRTGHTAEYFDPVLEENGAQTKLQGYITDALTDRAMQFIEANRDRPFLCYLPYNAPHTPLQVPARYLEPYLATGLDERTARVYAMIENLDENIGRLLGQLDELGLAENTIVLFLSDNGPINGWRAAPEEMRYNAGLRDQKFTVYEGGIRTQFFARWPGRFPAGRRVDRIAAYIDVLPTLLDLAHLDQPPDLSLDGRSLRSLLENPQATWPDRTLFMNYSLETLETPAPYPGGVARTQRFKMVDGIELYDLIADPGEHHNLAVSYPDTLSNLDQAYRAWWQDATAEGGFERRPIPVGYDAENPVVLMPHHARASGQLQFHGLRGLLGDRIGQHPTGVDGDWIANWTAVGDEARWEIDIVAGGCYEIALSLRCAPEDAGSDVAVTIGDKTLKHRVTEAIDWQIIPFGEVELQTGPQPLRVEALSITGASALELRDVRVRRINP